MMLLKDKLSGYRLILASTSPRRRQILADAGLPFVVVEMYEVEESWPRELPAEKVAEYLAVLKSRAYPRALDREDILLTADTTVLLDGRILGKPSDLDGAREMLATLSGREHEVITGVALRTPEKIDVFAARTAVKFRELTREEIDYYVDTYRPLDKAGAYGIQEWIGYVGIERIEGPFHNVMGLPIQMIYNRLNEL